jgi:hypothetical protein
MEWVLSAPIPFRLSRTFGALGSSSSPLGLANYLVFSGEQPPERSEEG